MYNIPAMWIMLKFSYKTTCNSFNTFKYETEEYLSII